MSEIPEFEIRESEDYKMMYAMGAFGGLAPNDGRLILYVDRLLTTPVRGKPGQEKVEKIIRERQVEIHMSPATWKSIARWMQDHVSRLKNNSEIFQIYQRGQNKNLQQGLLFDHF